MSGLRARLGVLCDQLSRHSSMEDLIRAAHAGDQLDELLAILRGSAEVEPGREEALLDAIDDACAREGLAPVDVRGNSRAWLPPGFNLPPDRTADTWVCPRGCCARVVFADEAPEPPGCPVAGVPMTAFPRR